MVDSPLLGVLPSLEPPVLLEVVLPEQTEFNCQSLMEKRNYGGKRLMYLCQSHPF